MSRSKDLREFKPVAASYGFSYEGKTSGGHYKWRGQGNEFVVTGSDLSRHRTWMNAERDMKAAARSRKTLETMPG